MRVIIVPTEMDSYRKRHRVADSKYRSKVQCLYGLLKEVTNSPYPKDSALINIQNQIKFLEDKLQRDHGLSNCEYRKEFLNVLHQEEIIWNAEKDVKKWWLQVQDLITNISCYQDSDALPAMNKVSHALLKPDENVDFSNFSISLDQNSGASNLFSSNKCRKSKLHFATKIAKPCKRNLTPRKLLYPDGKCHTIISDNKGSDGS